MTSDAPPPPYSEERKSVVASTPTATPTPQVLDFKCCMCKTDLEGCIGGVGCDDNRLFCSRCFIHGLCPRCDKRYMLSNICSACEYKRRQCEGCSKMFDDGVVKMGRILCNNLCSTDKPAPKPPPYVRRTQTPLIPLFACQVCAKSLNGSSDVVVYNKQLFCWSCHYDSQCPLCRNRTFMDHVRCIHVACNYQRLCCEHCWVAFDNGFIVKGRILCSTICTARKR